MKFFGSQAYGEPKSYNRMVGRAMGRFGGFVPDYILSGILRPATDFIPFLYVGMKKQIGSLVLVIKMSMVDLLSSGWSRSYYKFP